MLDATQPQGLLDLFKNQDAMRGLLHFGIGMMQPTPGGRFGAAVSNGLQAGVVGYEDALKRADLNKQRQLENRLKQAQIDKLDREQGLLTKRQETVGLLGKPKDLAPTVENAQNPQTYTPQDIQRLLMQSGDYEGTKLVQAMQPKYGAPHTVMGPNGPMLVQFDEQGNARPMQGLNPYNEKLDPAVQRFELEKAGRGATRITNNVIPKGETAASEAMGKLSVDTIKQGHETASGAAETVRVIDMALQALPDARTGFGAEYALGASRVLKQAGFPVGDVTNTEQLRAGLRKLALDELNRLKGPATEREQAFIQEWTGKIGSDPKALETVLTFIRDQNLRSIEGHNKRWNQFKSQPNMYTPLDYAVQVPAQQTQSRMTRNADGSYTYSPGR